MAMANSSWSLCNSSLISTLFSLVHEFQKLDKMTSIGWIIETLGDVAQTLESISINEKKQKCSGIFLKDKKNM